MRDRHRPRHQAPAVLIRLLRPVLRYSTTRDAYVLRVIGNQVGPVLVQRGARSMAGSV